MRAHGLDEIEPLTEAEDDWVAHHNEVTAATLLPKANSWWVGANIPGKPRTLYPYVGGVGNYRRICDDVAAKGYEGFAMAKHGAFPPTGVRPTARPPAKPARQVVG
jgi:cyclohexanone monooxygenase